MNLFAYGTLTCPAIMTELCGSLPGHEPALLRHYVRRTLREEDFPGIVPAPSGTVPGILYRELPADAWHALDRFEGDLYRRARVVVETEGGELEAAAYVMKPHYRHRVGESDWDAESFLRGGWRKLLDELRGE